MKWYAVTFCAPAEMTVHVLAENPGDAQMRAEDGNYEEGTDSDIHFVKGKPYTTKVRLLPDPEVAAKQEP